MVLIMFYLLFAVVFSAIIAIFAVQNAVLVTISFLTWKTESSLAVVVVIVAGIGILIALSIEMMIQVRLRLRLRQSGNRVKELEEQLERCNMQIVKLSKEAMTTSLTPPLSPLPTLEKTVKNTEPRDNKSIT